LMRRHGSLFEHNLHALRIVEQFEQKYADFPGLNLTFEVREGIMKHSRDYDPSAYPELYEYRLKDLPPVEAQIIDLADEIAYNCADLDDGYEARLLSLPMIREAIPLFDRFCRRLEKRRPLALEKLRFNEALRRLVDTLVTDLIAETLSRLHRQRVRSVEQVRGLDARVAGHSAEVAAETRRVKNFLHEKLYAHPKVGFERKGIAARMEKLFTHYLEHPRSTLSAHPAKAHKDSAAQTACDYIAGMTDNYFDEQYRKVFGG
ncbi:MAG: deoxyguanosinetriphosphate triphosphohydrolase, partial [Terriglobia bacterium]